MNKFHSEYLCAPSENRIKLRKLALEYYQRCEEYDRLVCTGPIKNGSVIPIGAELWLVNQNARKVFKELKDRMILDGLGGDLRKEIQLAERHFKYKE
jgi:hypothetical protein